MLSPRCKSLVLLISIAQSFVFVRCANPDYSYHVKIQDPVEANYQEKAETRKGDYTEGFYSVVEPNGALRTVTYTADEWGFKPTITYSYGHPVPPIKKLLLAAAPTAGAIVHSVPSVSYQQLYAPPGGTVAPLTFGAKLVTPVNQYAAAYPAPVVSVQETRQFIKSPQPQVLVTHQPQLQPHYTYAVPSPPPPPPVYHSYAQIEPAKQLYQFTSVDAIHGHAHAPTPSPTPFVVSQPAYLPPEPTPTPVYLPPSSTPVPTTYIPPPSPSPTYGPPVAVVGIRGASKTSSDGGYAYPVPEIKLEYPTVAKVQEVKIERPNGEYLPPPKVIVPPSPAPVLHVQELVTPVPTVKAIQHITYAAQPVQPLVHKVHYSAPPPPPPIITKVHYRQPVLKQLFATPSPTPIVQPVNYVQPNFQKVHYIQPTQPPPVIQRIQYSHEPAKVFHQQYHIARNVQHVIAVAPTPTPVPVQYAPHVQVPVAAHPPPQPVTFVSPPHPSPAPVKYEDIVIQNQHVMRYGEAPVLQYVQQPAPALPSPAPLVGSVKQNPLTFNYGFDTGVAKVSHSYYGSGW